MRRRITLVAATVAALVLPATAASALHCPQPNKPLGAGAVSGPSGAGNSGKSVLRGGFVDAAVVGSDHDVFLRGSDKSMGTEELGGLLGVELTGNGYGSLPEGHPFYEGHEEE